MRIEYSPKTCKFAELKPGDVFTYDDESGLYVCVEKNEYTRDSGCDGFAFSAESNRIVGFNHYENVIKVNAKIVVGE